MANLTAPSWGPASGGAPKQLVVLCHGVGASGQDLIGLAPQIGGALPDALIVAPDGPEACDYASAGRQWFSLRSMNPALLGAGARRAATALDGFIDATLAKHNLPPTAYALAGFSQGAMMVLFTGLRRAAAPRAILAYSGALVDAAMLAAEAKNHAPVLLVHGEADNVVPAFLSRQAETALRAAGIPVHSLFAPGLGHSMDDAGLAAGIGFLRGAFGATVAMP